MAYAQAQTMKATPSGVAGAITHAFTNSVVTGNRVFMFTSFFGGGATDIATPVQSAGTAVLTTFTQLVSASGLATIDLLVDCWTAQVTTGGTCTLSATNLSGGALDWTAAEYSGLDKTAGAGCLDVVAIGALNNGNTTNASTGTTSATTGANQLALCMVGDWGATATWTLATANGFVKDANLSKDADANSSLAVAAKTSASGATESAIWTNGGATDGDIAWVAVIKLAALPTVTQQLFYVYS